MQIRRISTAHLLPLLLAPCLVSSALDEAGIIERLNHASRCSAQKKWDEAAAAFQEILKSDPDNPNRHCNRSTANRDPDPHCDRDPDPNSHTRKRRQHACR